MLEIVNYNKDEYNFPALLVLGCFDAIHIGHAELLKKAKLQAKINGLDLGVMMFAEGKGGRQVFTFDERLEMLADYKTKFVLKIDYTDDFKKTVAADFLKNLEEHINIKGYMSGKDFRFGAGAKGKSSTLKNYADDEDNAVWYMSVKDVVSEGEKVSTTLIKQYIEEGKIQKAESLLGRKYFVSGEVCEGHGRGKDIGFPTANIIYPDNKVLVAPGVYGVEAEIDGTVYKGVANCGPRPTFGEDAFVMEVYFEGLNADLYGKTVTVKFLNYIRGVKKFESAEALAQQIAHDVTCIGAPDSAFEEVCAEACAEEAETEIAEAPAEKSEAAPVVAEQPAVAEEVKAEPAPVEETKAEVVETVEAVVDPEGEIAVTEEPEGETAVEKLVEEVFEGEVKEEPAEVEAPAEEPAVEAVEEIAEVPAEVEAPAEEPAAETVEEVAEAPAEVEEPTEEPAAEPVKEIAEEPAEVEAPAEEPAAETVEKVAEAPAEVEAPTEEPAVEPVEEAAEAPAEVEAPAEESAAETVEEAAEAPAEVEALTEEPAVEPVEESAEAPVEVETPAEEIKEEATEEAVEETAEAEDEASETEDEQSPRKNKKRRKGRGKADRRRGDNRKR